MGSKSLLQQVSIMSSRSNRNSKRKPKASPSTPVINPHCAGIDVGATEMYVCVPTDSCENNIGAFGAFTSDLLELASWLKECGVVNVVMESTGVYWIPLFEILEEQDFDVILVGNYPRKPEKTDYSDCQWLQYLHSVGLLKGSFRPPQVIRAIREILRRRSTLVELAAASIQRMQKSLTQMNLLLHNVISDITGVTGMAIIDAIIAGERDPHILALNRDKRIKATEDEIVKSLIGHYRSEHLFTLKQSREEYRFYQTQLSDCDAQIEVMLKDIDGEPPQEPTPKGFGSSHTKNKVDLPTLDFRTEAARIMGVDLAQIPGIGSNVLAAIITEAGPDLSAFPDSHAFASWLKLCPNPKISGGKKLGRAKPIGAPRLATALRQAAQTLERSDHYLGQFYRKMRSRFGGPTAVKATAHKLARIIYSMVTTKKPYSESYFVDAIQKNDNKMLNYIKHQAAKFGLTLTPEPNLTVS